MTMPTLALATILAVTAAGQTVVDRVAAIVEGRLVTASDVRAADELGLLPAGDGTALDRYIDRLLLLHEVDRFSPPEPDPAVVSARLAATLTSLGDGARGRLASVGMTEAQLRAWIRDEVRVRSYLDQRFAGVAQPTDNEVSAYLEAHRPAIAAAGEGNDERQRQIARDRLVTERRQALIADWRDGLRRRATIIRPQP